jgi:hypothetical protein
MSNSARPPPLRLVGSSPFDGAPETYRYKPSPEVEAAQPKLQRRAGRFFAQIELAWLSDPRFRGLISPMMRLWLLLQIRTLRGSRAVRLTNAMAADVDVDRHRKSDCLRRLEKLGLVKVVRSGNRNPEVRWLPPS